MTAVDNVSLSFPAGAVSALIGPNGAGKTTLFHLICGLLRPDAGAITLDGKRIDGFPPWRVARLGIGRLFQDVRLFSQLSVLDNIETGLAPSSSEDLITTIVRPGRSIRARRSIRADARTIADDFGLIDLVDKPAGEISYGQQKLVALARLTATRPRVVLLDEPFAGLSSIVTDTVLRLLRSWADCGCTILIIDHDLDVITAICQTVHFMDNGRLIASGTPQHILQLDEIKKRYSGLNVT